MPITIKRVADQITNDINVDNSNSFDAFPYTVLSPPAANSSTSNTVNVFVGDVTADTDAVFVAAQVQETYAYLSAGSYFGKISFNPFTLEPIRPIQVVVNPDSGFGGPFYLMVTVDPDINGFPAPAVLQLAVKAVINEPNDATIFFVNYTLKDEMTGGLASNVITVKVAPATASAQGNGSTTSAALSFPSSLDAIEAMYVGYFGTAGDLAGIGSSLGQIFSGTSLSSIAASFATQAAAIAEYPFLANPQSATQAQIDSFVTSVYETVFERAPTSTEQTSAEAALTANLGNSQFIDTFIYNTILGAQGADQTTVENLIGTAELTLYPETDYFAITRTALPVAQATTLVNKIIAGTTTETLYVKSLLAEVADTTIPAVAVEASMYGVTGSSNEITTLVTQVLPVQIATAIQNGANPVVYASEALGLQFAFADENGGTGFADNFGPSNAAMPATAAGDAAFAAAAASAIFGSAATANTPAEILAFVTNFEALYTANGIPGITNPTATQIDLAARGAAWGEAVGYALVSNLGPLGGETTNFLEDAAQGTAIYSAPLSSQPTAGPFQDNQIDDIYQSVLQRAPTAAEIASQTAAVSASGIAAVVTAVVDSPEAQFNVYPIIQIIQLATGNLPTAAQLAGWVPFIAQNGLLTGQAQANALLDQMAEAFVASDNFAKVYNPPFTGTDVDPNSAVTPGEMQIIIKAATGIAATQTQVNVWVGLGLTIDQVFVDFALGDQYTAFSQAGNQQYLTTVADAAASIQSSSVVGSTNASLVAHAA